MHILYDLLRAKVALRRDPRTPLAVRLHPADVDRLPRGEPDPTALSWAPVLFVDVRVPRGACRVAYTRAEVDAWREELGKG